MEKIRVGIYGYGNLGKGVEEAVQNADDMTLVGIFTRRNPEKIETKYGTKVISADDVKSYVGKIDVMILCGGSAKDLPIQSPELAKSFNIVDSFDTHANIPKHLRDVDTVSQLSGNIALLCFGWDPGVFSMMRAFFEAILPNGGTYPFWGPGVSQGHSDAIRRIDGVKDARQYTIPINFVVDDVRNGNVINNDGTYSTFSSTEMHERVCYVVPEEGADTNKIEEDIKNMPNYFKGYDTTVHFITEEELKEKHSGLPHGGNVIRIGKTGGEKQVAELSLELESNPMFTGSILTAYARAAYNMRQKGICGAKTIFDIPIIELFPADEVADLPRRLL